MSSEHDDDFVTAEVYANDLVEPSKWKSCKTFFYKSILVIVTFGLIALAVMQIIWMSAATDFCLIPGNDIAPGYVETNGDVCEAIRIS